MPSKADSNTASASKTASESDTKASSTGINKSPASTSCSQQPSISIVDVPDQSSESDVSNVSADTLVLGDSDELF